MEVTTKHCSVCVSKDTSSDVNHEHKSQLNYGGASGGMEATGALCIIRRSQELHGVRYVRYLGDGNSKDFLAVEPAKPYGDRVEICKLECIGHVKKRMGTHLRKLKKEMKGNTLSNGKSISGRGRLTDALFF